MGADIVEGFARAGALVLLIVLAVAWFKFRALTRTEEPYKVGYGKPPRHSQFRPGRSGNPGGRPRKAEPIVTQAERAAIVGSPGRADPVTDWPSPTIVAPIGERLDRQAEDDRVRELLAGAGDRLTTQDLDEDWPALPPEAFDWRRVDLEASYGRSMFWACFAQEAEQLGAWPHFERRQWGAIVWEVRFVDTDDGALYCIRGQATHDFDGFTDCGHNSALGFAIGNHAIDGREPNPVYLARAIADAVGDVVANVERHAAELDS